MIGSGERMSDERERLDEARRGERPWRRWGPYLSERQWGTVREDYGDEGDAWEHIPHDHARSTAYRWGEDGLLGVCDDRQRLCFGLALWNHRDPILKERLFGLTNAEGNHGEDVKELYYYLDSTPTHSFMRALYKYPQRAFPYDDLVATNAARGRLDHEYELVDTGAFDDDRYFDVFVDYAKAAPGDLLIRVVVDNPGPEDAPLRVLPSLWFRNDWRWGRGGVEEPRMEALPVADGVAAVVARHDALGEVRLFCEGAPPLRFTDNETNLRRHPGGGPGSGRPYAKDGVHRFVVEGDEAAINPAGVGTKVAADYALIVPAGGSGVIRLRLVEGAWPSDPFGAGFDRVFAARRAEADAFYDEVLSPTLSPDERRVWRQALAGMLWSKQVYEYDVERWLAEGGGDGVRNRRWRHLEAHDVISMPDKWEYPWFAVWDLAFHAIPLMLVDVDFAKSQLALFLSERYQRGDGAIPAYEWKFDDVNPPVHAWATLAVYQYDKARCGGRGDDAFLAALYEPLCRNFEWWTERKGVGEHDVFAGGFLGLDNIGVFDRSDELVTGGHLEQSDGTAWMVFFAQVMLRMSLELCKGDPAYEDRALYFLDRVVSIAGALDRVGDLHDEIWDEADGFFYDVLRLPDGHATRLHVRSLVGLLPLAAVSVFEPLTLSRLPRLRARLDALAGSERTANIHCPGAQGQGGRRMLAIVDEAKLRRVLSRMLDEDEFLSPHGIRSLSRYHRDHPYVFEWQGESHEVRYLPAESDSGMFGGNSNWRGPVWMPMNYLLLRALVHLHAFYGDDLRVECPTGSGVALTLYEVAEEIGRRLSSIFLRGPDGRRPVFGGVELLQRDPRFRDHLLFYEYFNGDDGAGVGASHQTGWTGCFAAIAAGMSMLSPAHLSSLDRARAAAER
ncbi:MAG: glucosidase [Proteobacteria bacterium]|nr:MAG: glucosidase [Pseudomonadota bacterium]